MKIILDTNILRQDFLIIFDEIISLYKRTLLEKYDKLIKFKKDFEKIMLNQSNIELPELDIENQIIAFKKNLTSKLKVAKNNIVPLNPDLVNRAMKRLGTFSRFDEVRDSIIWLTSLEIAEYEEERAIILIIKNTKDFAEKDGNLNSNLLEEANKKK